MWEATIFKEAVNGITIAGVVLIMIAISLVAFVKWRAQYGGQNGRVFNRLDEDYLPTYDDGEGIDGIGPNIGSSIDGKEIEMVLAHGSGRKNSLNINPAIDDIELELTDTQHQHRKEEKTGQKQRLQQQGGSDGRSHLTHNTNNKFAIDAGEESSGSSDEAV